MSKSVFSLGFGGAMALAMTVVSPSAHADSIRYRYVALDQVPLPAPYTSFSPTTVVDGRVFGTVFDDTFTIANIAEYDHGAFTIGPAGVASVADESGVVGGSTLSGQAAIFKHDDTVLVPQQPGAIFASVVGLAADKLALVSSTNSSFVSSFAYFRHGAESVIDFGLPDPVFGAFMNDGGVIGVTKEESAADHFLHGYRYDPRTQTSTLLPPFAGDPTDVMVLVQGINQRNEVLGYSFTTFDSPAYHERVGIWDRAGVFHPYFEETLVTQVLLFNERSQIVITETEDGNSYLVPQPGTRVNLADITRNVPAGYMLAQAVSIDDDGNIAGFAADPTFSFFFPFLLQPMNGNERDPDPVHVGHCPLPRWIAHAIDRRHPHK